MVKFGKLKLFSFLFPFVAVLLIFALMGVYPAGTKTMLTVDLYHQYMPFIYELRAKILEGRSLFYSWNGGLGNEYYAVFANYCASPLNLLCLLFPYKALPVFAASGRDALPQGNRAFCPGRDPRCAACAREGPSQGGNHAAQGDIRLLRLREPQLAPQVLQGADRQDDVRMARRRFHKAALNFGIISP